MFWTGVFTEDRMTGQKMSHSEHHEAWPETGHTPRSELERKIGGISWSIFVIWIGFAFLVDLKWGWGLIGIGLIILGSAAYRKIKEIEVENFWLVCGVMFLAGGAWDLIDARLPFIPVLVIIAGLIMLWGSLTGRHITK